MSDVVFIDKTIQPTDQIISEKLGTTYTFWKEIKDYVEKLVEGTTDE